MTGGGPSGPRTLAWAGGDGNWNTTAANWTGNATTYAAGDNVGFGNISGTTTVAVAAGGVTPASFTVDNDAAHPYTFVGGAIGGTTGLLKQGVGTLTLSNDNTFTGATTVAGGTLQVAGAFAATSIDVHGQLLQFNIERLAVDRLAHLRHRHAPKTRQRHDGADRRQHVRRHDFGRRRYAPRRSRSRRHDLRQRRRHVSWCRSQRQHGRVRRRLGDRERHADRHDDRQRRHGQRRFRRHAGRTRRVDGGTLNVGSGGAITGAITLTSGELSLFAGGTADSAPGITVGAAGTFQVAGGAVTGNGPITVAGRFVANGSVAASSFTVQSGGTLSGSGSIAGTVAVNDGGALSPGNSIESLSVGNLTLSGGADLFFEFRNATGSTPGTDWDLIDLGANGVLNLGDATASNPINLHIDSWKLDNSGHGGGVSDGANYNHFDPQADYAWLFIQAADLGKLSMLPVDDDFSRRFLIIDDALNGGVFSTADGNPFDRPLSSLGQGTFTVAWQNGSQGPGLYVHYSAIPEPGTLSLIGAAAAGFYLRRRRHPQSSQGVDSVS